MPLFHSSYTEIAIAHERIQVQKSEEEEKWQDNIVNYQWNIRDRSYNWLIFDTLVKKSG